MDKELFSLTSEGLSSMEGKNISRGRDGDCAGTLSSPLRSQVDPVRDNADVAELGNGHPSDVDESVQDLASCQTCSEVVGPEGIFCVLCENLFSL